MSYKIPQIRSEIWLVLVPSEFKSMARVLHDVGFSSYLSLSRSFIFLRQIALISTMLAGAQAIQAANISGTVFEDKNYGGSSGRSLASSSGVVRQNARVELFNAAGVYLSSTTTDASGNYTFSALVAGTYTIRVVNNSVTSSRGGAGLLPVQTYRTNASSGTAVAVTDYVGGETPAKADAGNGSTTLAALATATTAAQSITTVILSASNITGVDFGYSFNVIVNNNNTGQGSLRQFITNANALTGDASLVQSGLVAGYDNAVFMISNGTSGAGLRSANNFFAGVPSITSIVLTSALTTISTSMVIDAQQQPGWSGSPIVELNGTSAGALTPGLNITGGNCTIKGFVINRFGDTGINIATNGSNTIAGNYVGINAAGTAASPNGNDGIIITSVSNNIIGGTTANDRNIVSGNNAAANNSDGIWINGGGSNIVKGNYIGTNAAGTGTIGNYNGGVTITTSSNNTVGGVANGEGNLLSGNGNSGVIVIGGTGNAILSNSIYGNVLYGIDLEAAGVTANNGTKNSGLSNYDMDQPVFTTESLTGTTLTLAGYVGSAAGQAAFANATVQIFKSDNDASGYGEGKTLLGTLTTGGANGNFSGNITVSGLAVGDKLTGTATDASNNTSEFGANVTVTTPTVKTWDGGAGTNNWGDANNWNTNGVPTAMENVDLSGANTININVAATTNYITLNNAGLVLTINAGKSLVVSGGLTLTSGTLNTAAAFPTVAGAIDVSGGTVGFTGSGTQTIPAYNYNNLTSSSTGNRTLASTGSIGIGGTFTPGTNTYTITGSTVDYNASGAQTIAGFNYNNLTLSNAGVKTFSAGTTGTAGTLAITGSANSNATTNNSTINYNGPANQTATTLTYYNLNLTSSGTVTAPATLNINGNLLLSAGTFTAGTTINIKGNWINNGGTFVPGTNTVNFIGTGTETLGGTNVTSFYNLTINTAAATDIVQLTSNTIVTSVLNLTKGVIDLNSKALSVTSGLAGAVTRVNGYILSEKSDNSSKVIWSIGNNLTSHTYPFGTASGVYIPFTLNLTAGNIGNATISTYPTVANNTPYPATPISVTNMYSSTGSDNSANVVDRFWQIDKDGPSGTATITFTATAAEVGSILLPTAQRYETLTNKWQAPLPGQTSTATSATVPGVTTFSPWTLSSNTAILPIELVSFTAILKNEHVDLAWTTASELNNDYFTVEKTLDLVNYETVARKDGAGNSTHTLNYFDVDHNPYNGISYYRLRQTGFDGSVSYSEIIPIDRTSTSFFDMNVSPNPTTGNLNIAVTGTSGKEVSLIILDVFGRACYSKILSGENSNYTFTEDLHSRLAVGEYLVALSCDNTYKTMRLIVQ